MIPRESLGGGYWREGARVFFGSHRVSTTSPDAFQFLGGSWARDGDRVFNVGIPIRKADPGTFRVLNPLFAVDKAFVWYLGGRATQADAASFETLDTGVHFRAPGASPYSFQGYARDARFVLHYTMTVGRPCVVRGAQRGSFQSLNGVFGRDAAGVFVDHRRIATAEPGTWIPLAGYYSRDARSVFYGERLVKGADVDSFMCLVGRLPTWARDRSHYYDVGVATTREAYLEELSLTARSHAHLAERLTANQVSCHEHRFGPA